MAATIMASACSGGYREPYYTSDKEPAGTGEMVNGGREGIWTQQASNGQVVWRGTYANGRRQGSWKEWNEEGKALVECSYDQNRLHGEAKIYHWGINAGKLERIESYNHGLKDGEWRHFELNTGKILKIDRYAKGQLHGAQLTTYRDGSLAEVLFDKDVPVLERRQKGGELTVYQLDAQKRHHGLWITVCSDVITDVVQMENGEVRTSLYSYTLPGTQAGKRKAQPEGAWSWTAIISPRCKYAGGFNPATKEASVYRHDLLQVWNSGERWTMQDGKVMRHEKKELGPNGQEFVWVPADQTAAPPAAALETIVVNPPSKVLKGFSLPLDPIQVPTP
jgi:antitoxin component YwqK of YwqJK toxin-antitoxin module